MNAEYLLQGIVFSKLANNQSSSYYDIAFTILIIIMISMFNSHEIKENIITFINSFLKINNNESVISFVQPTKGRSSNRFNALMYYISKNKNKTIKKIAEKVEFIWSRGSDNQEENSSCYRIDQEEEFSFTEDIKGRFWIKKEEESTGGERSIIKRYYRLEVFSKKINIYQLTKWVEKINKEYKNHLLNKMLDSQHILNVNYDLKDKYILIEAEKWSSNVTFENRFFKKKKEVIKKLDFFLNNEEWYKKKGIPHTLGFLLHGKPGCGKTSFIKIIANYTKRHIIDVKLNDSFDLNELKNIIQKEELNDDYYIPNNKRIIVFEDIDCMGDIVKKRKENNNNENSKKISLDKISKDKTIDLKEITNLVEICNKKDTNNLSFFLNILDGLIECNGRIIIMTTNKPDFLDPALIRPGRVDINIKFEEVNIEEFKNIFSNYYDIPIEDVPTNNIELIDGKYTPAEIINKCRSYINYKDCYDNLI